MAARKLEWLTLNRLNPARRKFEHLIPGHLTLIMILENDGIRFAAITKPTTRQLFVFPLIRCMFTIHIYGCKENICRC
jgi:hypothetical protein